MKTWYAVQETREDAWDYGSADKAEAIKMLKEQGHGLIAVINEETNYCEDEIWFDEIEPEDSFTVIMVGGEDDGKELAVFAKEIDAINFARNWETENPDDALAIFDPDGNMVENW